MTQSDATTGSLPTIAVTGGTGRIGRAVTAMALERGHTVISIDRALPPDTVDHPNLSFREVDVTDHAEFKAAIRGAEALIHLAAIPSPNRHPADVVHNNNVVGSYNALIIAAELGIRRVCQASSVNATGAVYSRAPRYDYFPLDELHPTYNEDPYSLSKWICEEQGDSIARRHSAMTISSLRFHAVVSSRQALVDRIDEATAAKQLWGYTLLEATARSCLDGISASYPGHEAFFIIAPDAAAKEPTPDLVRRFYPDVPLRHELGQAEGLYDCSKAARLLNWVHGAD